MTVEGERDDICGLGQTEAAHDLCTSVPDDEKVHYVQQGVGHFGVFNGTRWRTEIQPRIREFIRTIEYKRLAGSEDTRSPQPIRIARDTLEVTAAAVVTPASDVTPEWRREAERFAQRRQWGQRQASADRHSSTSSSITFCSSRRFARLRWPCLRLPILMSFCV